MDNVLLSLPYDLLIDFANRYLENWDWVKLCLTSSILNRRLGKNPIFWKLRFRRELSKITLSGSYRDAYLDVESEIRGKDLNQILIIGAQRGYENLVQRMVARGATKTHLALEAAAGRGQLKIVKLLVPKICDISYLNWALIEAVSSGNMEIIKVLIERGANDFDRALLRATTTGKIEIVKYFRSTISDLFFLNLSMIEAAAIGHLEIVKYLVEQGATEFNKAFNAASNTYRQEVIKFILPYVTDVDYINSVIIEAAYREDLEIIKFLFDQGFSPTRIWQPIEIGISRRNLELVKFLLPLVSDISDLNTFLMSAVNHGYLDIVRLLIQRGANDFSRAMKIAIKFNHLTIVKYLRGWII
jgi:ankyrin repeat protein